MIHIERAFDTEADAKEYKARLYTLYPPARYGTRLEIEYQNALHDHDKWVVKGDRAESRE